VDALNLLAKILRDWGYRATVIESLYVIRVNYYGLRADVYINEKGEIYLCHNVRLNLYDPESLNMLQDCLEGCLSMEGCQSCRGYNNAKTKDSDLLHLQESDS